MSRNQPLPMIQNCSGCGVCCLHMGYPAFNLPEEELLGEPQFAAASDASESVEDSDRRRWRQLPSTLRLELQKHIRGYHAPGEGQLDTACIWLDPETRLCKHHQHRPQVCRDFEIGSRLCRQWRQEYRGLIQTEAEK